MLTKAMYFYNDASHKPNVRMDLDATQNGLRYEVACAVQEGQHNSD